MAHFSKVRDGVVIETIISTAEELSKIVDTSPGAWIQTSYNTHGGVHYDPVTGQPSADQSKALRGNFAGPGMLYDDVNDVFYKRQPYPSWTLNTTTWTWEAPTPKPGEVDEETGYPFVWDEATTSWVTVVGTEFPTRFDPEVNPYVPPEAPTLPPLTEV
jgi:hypothetical protein